MIGIFFAQATTHTLWYLDVRAAHAQQVGATVLLDVTYGLLTLYTFKHVLEPNAPRQNVVAYLLGGALGTAIGVSLPV